VGRLSRAHVPYEVYIEEQVGPGRKPTDDNRTATPLRVPVAPPHTEYVPIWSHSLQPSSNSSRSHSFISTHSTRRIGPHAERHLRSSHLPGVSITSDNCTAGCSKAANAAGDPHHNVCLCPTPGRGARAHGIDLSLWVATCNLSLGSQHPAAGQCPAPTSSQDNPRLPLKPSHSILLGVPVGYADKLSHSLNLVRVK
jgi:hypothetical protein